MTEKIAHVPQRTYEIWGNWKMNPDSIDEAELLAMEIRDQLLAELSERGEDAFNRINVGLFVPDLFLAGVGHMLEDDVDLIDLGVQNMYFEPDGAFTGESSASMIKSIFTYAGRNSAAVLIGHSERRTLFGETDKKVNLKMHAAINNGMRPFLAIGETVDEREEGVTEEVLERQLLMGLDDISAKKFHDARGVIAYEPVWAIGTGKTATPEMANEAHAHIRRVVANMYGDDIAERTTIQYGGSMNAKNAGALLAQKHIDGGLIGGASLKAASFGGIVAAAPLIC